ncbi:hypothetical protein [Komagataeibacter europaeus]|uniref:hypothetical protein n=1 Tax=Komagataeibacter europaeus TaxID=33995 RepID=UPI0012FB0F47|nr:hypothetical protein [Komagataeibacter europaeus]GBQ46699.1 hypothetical protein AA18890_2648 [Komagataeibacter europaeus LMG 18890]
MQDDQKKPAGMTPEEAQEFKEKWAKILPSDKPALECVFDLTTTVTLSGDGSVYLDCPSLHFPGFDRAQVVRARLTSETVSILKHALAEAEKNPGKPVQFSAKNQSH